jgi:hypothetical protein
MSNAMTREQGYGDSNMGIERFLTTTSEARSDVSSSPSGTNSMYFP